MQNEASIDLETFTPARRRDSLSGIRRRLEQDSHRKATSPAVEIAPEHTKTEAEKVFEASLEKQRNNEEVH
jgi:hypothetical protein